MELALAILIIVALEVSAVLGGADTRPGINDEPRRAI
jgi:hypothetical protein